MPRPDFEPLEVSKTRKQIHGKLLYADRLCKNGRMDEAKKYCAQNGLPFPPFSDTVTATAAKTNETAPPSPPATTSEEGHGVQREAATGSQEKAEDTTGNLGCSPIETSASEPPKNKGAELRPCRVTGFCPNPKFAIIKFDDDGEVASVWRERQYKLHESLLVELERGTRGINGIYAEKRKTV